MTQAALASLDGDGQAALRLSDHFLAIGRFDQADGWLQVAVGNRDRDATYRMAMTLADAPDSCKKRRAAALFRKLSSPNPQTDAISRDAARGLQDVTARLRDFPPSNCRYLLPTYQHSDPGSAERRW